RGEDGRGDRATAAERFSQWCSFLPGRHGERAGDGMGEPRSLPGTGARLGCATRRAGPSVATDVRATRPPDLAPVCLGVSPAYGPCPPPTAPDPTGRPSPAGHRPC